MTDRCGELGYVSGWFEMRAMTGLRPLRDVDGRDRGSDLVEEGPWTIMEGSLD